ncbi:MAG: hypothetical protein IJA34_11085, partial [Lachnospiraceae bacterium]|nr:hypothetical protein [Lachnospiraceae bacterium]
KKNDNDDNPIVITEPDIEKWGHVDNRVSENGAVNGDADTYTYTFTDLFIDDADYEVSIECTDKAGNECELPNYEGKATREFTIDNINPVINSNAEKGFYGEPKEIKIDIVERNFSEDDVKIYVTRKINGKEQYKDKEYKVEWNQVDGEKYKYQAVIKFEENGTYAFRVDYKDKADRPYEYNYENITIDISEPNICFNPENVPVWINENNITSTYANIKVKVDDDISGLKSIVTKIKRYNKDKLLEEVILEDYKFENFSEEYNPKESKEYDIITEKLPDGEYVIEVVAVDKFDRESFNTIPIKKDTQQPEGYIQIKDNVWKKIFNTITFGIFSKDAVDIMLTVKDDVKKDSKGKSSGIAKVEYLRTNVSYTTEENCRKASGWVDCTSKVGTEGKYGIIDTANPKEKNENLIFYVRITDTAENVKYISSNGIVLDSELPKNDLSAPMVDVKGEEPKNGIYKDSLKLTFTVTDPEVNGVVSGIKYIEYYVKNEDTGDSLEETIYVTEKVLKEHNISKIEQATTEILQKASTREVTIDIPIEKFNSNNVKVVVNAVDNAENEMPTEILSLKLDNTKPKVCANYINNDVKNDKYFDKPREIILTVTERNFDPENTKIIIKKNDNDDNPIVITEPDIEKWGHVDNRVSENG